MVLNLSDVKAYLGPSTTADNATLNRVFTVERKAQAAACNVPAVGSGTVAEIVLEEALLRRIAVNLARRGLPLGMQMSDVGAARISSSDPEVRRLELPYRKTVVG